MVRPSQAVSLIDIILENNCRKIAEIGVWKGHTTRYILREIGSKIDSYWAIDQWDVMGDGYGRMSKLSYEDWTRLYKRVCQDMIWFENLHVVRAKSLEVAEFIKNGYFDLVFIDSDHYYEYVVEDVNAWISKVKKGGILCGHDYGVKKHEGVKRAIDEIFGDDNIEIRNGAIWLKRT